MAKLRTRRRQIGAAVAIFFALAATIGVSWGAENVLWGALAGLGTGALGWGLSFLGPAGDVVLTDTVDDDREHGDSGESSDSGDGISSDGGIDD